MSTDPTRSSTKCAVSVTFSGVRCNLLEYDVLKVIYQRHQVLLKDSGLQDRPSGNCITALPAQQVAISPLK